MTSAVSRHFATSRWRTKLIEHVTSKLILIGGTLLTWQGFAIFVNKSYLVPSPLNTIKELFTHSAMYIEAVGYTGFEAVGGLFLGISAALSLALLIFFVPSSEKYVMPYAIAIKSTPVLAAAPLLTVWLGPGLVAKIIMSALISFFPILQNMVDGLKSVPEGPKYYVQVLGTKPYRALGLVLAWFAMRDFASALKVAAPLAVVGAMASEFLGADVGVGHLLFIDVTKVQTREIFAAILSVMIIGWSLYASAYLFEYLTLKRLKMEREPYAVER